MKTTVVNLKNELFDVYIGRGPDEDFPSFGNPFKIGEDGTREEVVKKFEEWLRGKIPLYEKQRTFILENMWRLKGKKLGCFCSPKACHGDIYVKLLEEKGEL